MVDLDQLDEDELKAYSFKIWSYKQGELVSLMIHLGDRLGLYKALQGEGPISAEGLAAKTGYHPRWLLEWLKNQAAARILNYHDGDLFELGDVGAAVMAQEEDSLIFAAGAFNRPTHPDIVEKLAEAFKTGIGLSYQALGPSGAHGVERMLGPWTRLTLVPKIIPAIPGVQQKLEQGAVVADIGCGGGIAIATLAEAFPKSRFHGFDPSAHAIDNANSKAAELDNLEVFVAGGEDLPSDPTYDFVITFDCMHDMTRPDLVMKKIHLKEIHDGP